jgi:outer membrane protein assembly factor BamE
MINFKNMFYLVVFTVFILTSVGCVEMLPEAHKIDIHQGNLIDPERIEQLEIGMSKEQVKYLLGTPVSNNLFHADRWDYLHYISKAGSYAKPKRITIFFVNDTVASIDDQYTTH